jgi:hypothetical protein
MPLAGLHFCLGLDFTPPPAPVLKYGCRGYGISQGRFNPGNENQGRFNPENESQGKFNPENKVRVLLTQRIKYLTQGIKSQGIFIPENKVRVLLTQRIKYLTQGIKSQGTFIPENKSQGRFYPGN